MTHWFDDYDNQRSQARGIGTTGTRVNYYNLAWRSSVDDRFGKAITQTWDTTMSKLLDLALGTWSTTPQNRESNSIPLAKNA